MFFCECVCQLDITQRLLLLAWLLLWEFISCGKITSALLILTLIVIYFEKYLVNWIHFWPIAGWRYNENSTFVGIIFSRRAMWPAWARVFPLNDKRGREERPWKWGWPCDNRMCSYRKHTIHFILFVKPMSILVKKVEIIFLIHTEMSDHWTIWDKFG